jgi:glycopeptide antibiotics resistance protein
MFGLWPFNLNQNNEVHWIEGERGLEFHRAGIDRKYFPVGVAYSEDSYRIPSNPENDSASVTVELLFKPGKIPRFNFGSIVAFKDEEKATSFVISQWKKSLIVRKHDAGVTTHRHYDEIDLLNALTRDSTILLTITSGSAGTKLYVNGEFKKQRKELHLVGQGRSIVGKLILGNSAAGREPWAGKIYGLSIYESELSALTIAQHYQSWLSPDTSEINAQNSMIALYTFEEGQGTRSINKIQSGTPILIPEKFTILQKIILEPPWYNFSFNLAFIFDFTINILGFIPMGIMLTLLLRNIFRLRGNRLFVLTFLIGSATSFLIEILQIWMPQRHSSLSDLILNITGLLIGFGLVQLILFLKRKILKR